MSKHYTQFTHLHTQLAEHLRSFVALGPTQTTGWAPPAGLTNTSSSSNLVFPGGLPSRHWPVSTLLSFSGQPVLGCRVIWLLYGWYACCCLEKWVIYKFLMLYFVIMVYYYCLYYFCHTNALLIYKHTDISQKITKHCSIFCPDFWLKLKTAVIVHSPKTLLLCLKM